MTVSEFDIDNENQWCPGCGNFAILQAMKKAFTELAMTPKDLLVVSGIGQAGKTPNFIACNMLHGLHGRALPLATGVKIANHKLNVVVNSGDGDCYGEGAGHFLAAIRRNVDITLLVHNNQIYGLTKGQASPTSGKGMRTKMQQSGTLSDPFNPLTTALVNGAGFVARGFSGNTGQLCDLIQAGIAYKGFALIDIFQPCVSFNKINTHLWYRSKIYDLGEAGHDSSDYRAALEAAHKSDRFPTGVLFQKEIVPFHERLVPLKNKALIEYSFNKSQMNDILCHA